MCSPCTYSYSQGKVIDVEFYYDLGDQICSKFTSNYHPQYMRGTLYKIQTVPKHWKYIFHL